MTTPSSAAFARPASSSPAPRSCANIPTPPSNRSGPVSAAISVVAAPTPACCWPSSMPPKKEERDMAKVEWPAEDKRSLIGKRIDRIDGPLKATGAAKYSYDINRPGMLWAKVVTSPHPHAEITSIDTSAAEALAGVKGVWRDTEKEVRYAGEIVAAVAAGAEGNALEAPRPVQSHKKPLEKQGRHYDASVAEDKNSQ